jgi:hypothetical protein
MRKFVAGGIGALAFIVVVWGWLAAGTIMPRAAGAIAIGSCAAYGYAYDFSTVKQAHDAAIENCNGSCKQVVTTQKGCAALAVDGHKPCGARGYANASRLGAAQNTALRTCYKNGGRDCMIRAWICDAKG